ncbi:MAG: hypothetical protein CMO20_04105 [Thermoplasmata archaeon]|mgnify:CR=1 FL=1|nr:hypothetical protein [Thermoplasmata archaeon]
MPTRNIMDGPIQREVGYQNSIPVEKKWISSKGNEISIIIPPTVYPPREDTNLIDKCISLIGDGKGKKLLEIGCGTGVVSISAAFNGWDVVACDINPLAVASTIGNAIENNVEIKVYEEGVGDHNKSNKQLENIFNSEAPFDLIIWNLPYLEPINENEIRLGPLEDAGLLDNDGEKGWGELLISLLEEKPRMLKNSGAVYLIHTNNIRGNMLQSNWRLAGWATRTIEEYELGDGERITCFSAWRPFQGTHIEWHDEIESTNRFLLDKERKIGQCIIARKQTSGRGQRDREWITNKGDFAGSWNLDPNIVSGNQGNFQLSAALSVVDSICALTKTPLASSHWTNCKQIKELGINLQWPNDVWNRDGKIAGCLIEGRQFGGKQKIVLGIGVNITSQQINKLPIASINDVITNKELNLEEYAKILNCSISSLYENHELVPNINDYTNSIWNLMSNHLSPGKFAISDSGMKLNVCGLSSQGELICHDGKFIEIITDSYTRKWSD